MRIAVLIVVVLFFGCEKRSDYIIEKSGDIEVVKNLNKRVDRGLKYSFELVAEIKNSDEKDYSINFPNYQMGRNFDISVDIDDELNLYVADFGNNRVLKLDREGNLISTFGREGQGPGEFPGSPIVVDFSEDKLYVIDLSRRLTIFDRDGSLIDHYPLEVERSRAFYDFIKSDNSFIVINEMYDGKWGSSDFKSGYGVATVDINSKSTDIIHSFMEKFDLQNLNSENYLAGVSHYNGSLSIADLSRNSFSYKIVDLKSGEERKVVRPYVGISRSEETLKIIEESLDKAEQKANNFYSFRKPEKMKQSISYLFHDEKGNLLASTNESMFSDGGHTFSAFDESGIYLGDISVPELNGMFVKNCGEYCIATTSISDNYLNDGKSDPVVQIFKLNLSYKKVDN